MRCQQQYSGRVLARLSGLFGKRTAEPDLKSIAVLPFGNLNRDEETEYFSAGITEDIIAHLSRIGDLKVISRTSVMRFKGTDASMTKIGRELGVRTVLEGSVRRVGERVRIVSQLIDVRADAPIWSETFDRRITDIFDIQTEIAQRIAEALVEHLDARAAGCVVDLAPTCMIARGERQLGARAIAPSAPPAMTP